MSMGYQNGGNNQQPKGQQGGIQQPKSQQQGGEADWNAIKDDVGEIAGVAVERGRHFLDSARDQAVGYVDRRKDDVAKSVTDFAGSLRESTRSFDDRPNIQAFVDGAAEGLDQLAETIRGRSFAEIFNEMEHVVRRRPTAVAAVTLTAGFLLARFIKASAEGLRHEQARQSQAGRQARQGQAGGQSRQGQAGGMNRTDAQRGGSGAGSRA